MLRQLLLMSAAFHAVNVASLLFCARLWRHRYAEEPVIRPRVAQIVADLGVLGSLACVSALGAGALNGADGFGVINLMSQWVFSEFPALLLLSAYWLRRSGAAMKAAAFATLTAVLAGIFIDAHFVEPRALDLDEHVVDARVLGPRAMPASRTLAAMATGPGDPDRPPLRPPDRGYRRSRATGVSRSGRDGAGPPASDRRLPAGSPRPGEPRRGP
jgi:hypothetical protein